MRRYSPSKAEIAAVESTNPTELDELANHANKFVRSRVAKNPATEAPTLTRLATDPDDYVRSAVARHRHTPPQALAAMVAANDTSRYVRQGLASNPNTPSAGLVPAAGDDYYTRRSIAENPNTDPETLRSLASDRDTTIVQKVAENKSTPEDVLVALAAHPSPSVAQGLSRHNFDPRTAQWRTITVRRQVGRRYETTTKRVPVQQAGRFPAAAIQSMATSEHQVLRQTAASQPDAPIEVMERLMGDEDMWVRSRLAENPSLPGAMVVQMARTEPEARLIATVAARADLPDEAIIAIAARRTSDAHSKLPDRSVEVLLAHPDPAVRATATRLLDWNDTTVWAQMLADPTEEVRVAAAAHCPLALLNEQVAHPCKKVRAALADRALAAEILVALASDDEVTVRRRVVKNSHCPAEAMMGLAADRDQRVRAHAAARFMEAMTRGPGVPGAR